MAMLKKNIVDLSHHITYMIMRAFVEIKMFNKEKARAYYLKEFKKIEKGKISWNWCAAIFGWYWFIYRKVYSGLLYSVAAVVLYLIMLFVVLFSTGIKVDSPAVLGIIGLSYLISLSLFCGFFANRWYYSAVKSKIKIGAHLYEEYQSTDVRLLVFLMLLPPLFLILHHVCGFSGDPSTAVWGAELGVILAAWKMEKNAIEKNAKDLGEFSTEINEENISKLV